MGAPVCRLGIYHELRSIRVAGSSLKLGAVNVVKILPGWQAGVFMKEMAEGRSGLEAHVRRDFLLG